MLATIGTWLRGIAQLRHSNLVADMGERRFHLDRISQLRRQFPQSKLSADLRLIGEPHERLQVGVGSSIEAGTLLAFGDEQNGYGRIVIGDHTWIGQYNNFRASGEASIVVGTQCLISQFCTVVASNHACVKCLPIAAQGQDSSKRGVSIGDDVWLGAGVTLTPGVTVHDGVIVGAGAVVTCDVPAYEIWAGVPARKIGERKENSSVVNSSHHNPPS